MKFAFPFQIITASNLGLSKTSITSLSKYLPSRSYGSLKQQYYINTNNGNLCLVDHKISIVDQGFIIQLCLIYNSLSATWHLPYSRHIVDHTEGEVTVVEDDGSSTHFIFDAVTHQYICRNYVNGNAYLRQTEQGWVWSQPSTGLQQSYSTEGFLTQISNAQGKKLKVARPSPTTVTMTGESGQVIIIESTAEAYKIYRQKHGPKRLLMQYDKINESQVSKLTIPINQDSNYEVNYSYYPDNHKLKTVSQSDGAFITFNYQRGKLSQLVDGERRRFSLEYSPTQCVLLDSKHNRTQFIFDSQQFIKTVILANSTQVEYEYDECQRLRSFTSPEKSRAEYKYDAFGTVAVETDPMHFKTVIERDEKTALVKSITRGGRKQRFLYNEKHQKHLEISARGSVTEYLYDADDNLKLKRVYSENLFVESKQDITTWLTAQPLASTHLTSYQHDEYGQITHTVEYALIDDAGKGVMTDDTSIIITEYDYRGLLRARRVRLHDDQFSAHLFQYDGLCRLVEETQPDLHKHRFSYDQVGIVVETDPNGCVHKSCFDRSGLLVRKVLCAADEKRETAFQRDVVGCLICTTDPDQHQTQYQYDPLYRISKCIKPPRRVTQTHYHTDSNAKIVSRYDEQDQKQVRENIEIRDKLGRVRFLIRTPGFIKEMVYHDSNVVTMQITFMRIFPDREIQALIQDPSFHPEIKVHDRITRYFYDSDLNLELKHDASGYVTRYFYNAANDKISECRYRHSFPQEGELKLPEPDSKQDSCTEFQLNARSQVIKIIAPEGGITTNSYYPYGLLKREETATKWQSYKYDSSLREIECTDQSGLIRRKSYSPTGKVIYLSHEDQQGICKKRAHTYRYNEFGDKVLEVNAYGGEIKYEYGPSGQLISTQDPYGNKKLFFYNSSRQLQFSVDEDFNITEYSYNPWDHDPISTCHYVNRATDLPATEQKTYLASLRDDALDRLSSCEFNDDGILVVLRDELGYETRKSYNACRELVQVSTPVVDNEHRKFRILYRDKLGNIVRKLIKGYGSTTIETTKRYNHLNCMVQHIDERGQMHSYEYDRNGAKTAYINPLQARTEYKRDQLSRLTCLTRPDQVEIKHEYEEQSRLRRVRYPDGTFTETSFSVHGQIVGYKDRAGASTQKEFDKDGQLSVSIDAEGGRKSYTRNLRGWITDVTCEDGLHIHFDHNRCGDVVREVRDPDGLAYTKAFTRSSFHEVKEEVSHERRHTQYQYSKRGQLILSVVDPAGLQIITAYSYHADKRLKRKTRGEYIIEPSYDDLGRLHGQVIDPQHLQIQHRTILDSQSKPVVKLDPMGHKSYLVYDHLGQISFEVSAKGQVTQYIYNINNDLIEKRRYLTAFETTAVRAARLTLEQMMSWQHTQQSYYHHYFCYNDDRRLVFEVLEYGVVIGYLHDVNGNQVQSTLYENVIDLSQIASMDITNIQQALVSSAKDRVSIKLYDSNNRVIFKVDADGYVTELIYNKSGNKVTQIQYSNQLPSYPQGPYTISQIRHSLLLCSRDQKRYYVRDVLNRLNFYIDEKGRVTKYIHDSEGCVTQTRLYSEPISVSALPDVSRVQSLLKPCDEKDIITQARFDAAGRVIEKINGRERVNHYQYNDSDDCILHIDQMGDEWQFRYDSAKRQIERVSPAVEVTDVLGEEKLEAKAELRQVTTQTHYDKSSQVISVVKFSDEHDRRTLNFIHDQDNLLIHKSQQRVPVDDGKMSAHDGKPESHQQLQEVEEVIRRDVFGNAFATKSKTGVWHFAIFNAVNKVIAKIDAMGNVTVLKRNAFEEVVEIKQYNKPISCDLQSMQEQPLTIHELSRYVQPDPDNDRVIKFIYNRRGLKVETVLPEVFMYCASQQDVQYGVHHSHTKHDYDAFRNLVKIARLVNPWKQSWEVELRFYDGGNNLIATIDPMRHLTTHKYNFQDLQSATVEYELPIDEYKQTPESSEDFLRLAKHGEKDRYYQYKYTKTGKILSKTLKHFVYHRVRVSQQQPLQVQEEVKPEEISWLYVYDDKDRLISVVDPEANRIIKYYNAFDEVIAIADKARQCDSSTTRKLIPLTIFGYDAFLKRVSVTKYPSCKTADPLAYELCSDNPVVKRYLFKRDSRGCVLIEQDPEGALTYKSYYADLSLAREWQFITGWQGTTRAVRLLHALHQYDARGKLTAHKRLDFSGEVITKLVTHNAFGEVTSRDHEVMARDKQGYIWRSNSERGIPTLTFRDACGRESVRARAMHRDLNQVNYDSLARLPFSDVEKMQLTQLSRDAKGRLQFTKHPSFHEQDRHAPTYKRISVSVFENHPVFGRSSLVWRDITERFHRPILSICPKGHENLRQERGAVLSGEYYGVNLGDLPTDIYQYRIDYYYHPQAGGIEDKLPRFFAEGEINLITAINTQSKNIVVVMQDEDTLLVAGKTQGLTGVELISEGEVVGRFPAVATERADVFSVALHHQVTGEYSCRPVYGEQEEKEFLSIGRSHGITLVKCATTFKIYVKSPFEGHYHYYLSWHDIPPGITRIKPEYYIEASGGSTAPAKRVTIPVRNSAIDVPARTHKTWFEETHYANDSSIHKFYGYDRKGALWYLGEAINKISSLAKPDMNETPDHYLYIYPGAYHKRIDKVAMYHNGNRYVLAAERWMNGSYRVLVNQHKAIINASHFRLISLTESPVLAAPSLDFSIFTSKSPVKLTAREIPLSFFTHGTYVHPPKISLASPDPWRLPKDLMSNRLRLKFKITIPQTGKILDYEKCFADNSIIYILFFRRDYKGQRIQIDVEIKDKWITLYNDVMDQSGVMDQYKQYTYKTRDNYTLYFSPIPPGVHSAIFEYYNNGRWNQVDATQITSNSIALPSTAIASGLYQYRLLLKNIRGDVIDMHHLADVDEKGYAYGTVAIKPGKAQHFIPRKKPLQTLQMAYRETLRDRWGNIIHERGAVNDCVDRDFNALDQCVLVQEPQVQDWSESEGKMIEGRATHRQYFNLSGAMVCHIDSRGKPTFVVANSVGQPLKVIRANGAVFRRIFDGFGHVREMLDPLGHKTQFNFNLLDKMISREDAEHVLEKFIYDEKSRRIAFINGRQHYLRFDRDHDGQISARIKHSGRATEYHRVRTDSGAQLTIHFANGDRVVYSFDHFGNLNKVIDIEGYVTHIERNFSKQVIHRYGEPGQARTITFVYNQESYQILPQDVVYVYNEAGLLKRIVDQAANLNSHYLYDSAMRRIGETYTAGDGETYQSMFLRLDAKSRIIEIRDAQYACQYMYDPADNRIRTYIQYYPGLREGGAACIQDNWYSYGSVDQLCISRGKRIDGSIQIVKGQGTEILYDIAGRKTHEWTMTASGTKQVTYGFYDNDQLHVIESPEYHAEMKYDAALSRVSFLEQKGSVVKEVKSSYDDDEQLREQKHFEDSVLKTHTTLTRDASGLVTKQVMVNDKWTETLNTRYVGFERRQILESQGEVVHEMDIRTPKAQVLVRYDANHQLRSKEGDLKVGHATFTRNNLGRIVFAKNRAGQTEFYFYDPRGRVIGRAGYIPQIYSANFMALVSKKVANANFDLSFHVLDKHHPQAAVMEYVTHQGDSFADISRMFFGDGRYGEEIALYNGMMLDDVLVEGQSIRVPMLSQYGVHNKADVFAPYDEQEIVGSLHPNYNFKNLIYPKHLFEQQESGGGLFAVFVDFFISAILMEITGGLSAVFLEFVPQALVPMVTAASIGMLQSITTQLANEILGVQHGFSWDNVWRAGLQGAELGLATSIVKPSMSVTNNAFNAESVLHYGERNVLVQVMRLATGQSHSFDWRELMAASLADPITNKGAVMLHGSAGHSRANLFKRIRDQLLHQYVYAKLIGKRSHANAMLLEALGTVMGERVGQGLDGTLRHYQEAHSHEKQLRRRYLEAHREPVLEEEEEEEENDPNSQYHVPEFLESPESHTLHAEVHHYHRGQFFKRYMQHSAAEAQARASTLDSGMRMTMESAQVNESHHGWSGAILGFLDENKRIFSVIQEDVMDIYHYKETASRLNRWWRDDIHFPSTVQQWHELGEGFRDIHEQRMALYREVGHVIKSGDAYQRSRLATSVLENLGLLAATHKIVGPGLSAGGRIFAETGSKVVTATVKTMPKAAKSMKKFGVFAGTVTRERVVPTLKRVGFFWRPVPEVESVPQKVVHGTIRGQHSGRMFNPAEAGGPLRDLAGKQFNVRITTKGIDVVEKHISRFDYDAGNAHMLNRLREIASGKLSPTRVDYNFYTHELREYVRFRRLGLKLGDLMAREEARIIWENAHTATLEEYGLRSEIEELYASNAIEQQELQVEDYYKQSLICKR